MTWSPNKLVQAQVVSVTNAAWKPFLTPISLADNQKIHMQFKALGDNATDNCRFRIITTLDADDILYDTEQFAPLVIVAAFPTAKTLSRVLSGPYRIMAEAISTGGSTIFAVDMSWRLGTR